MKTPALFRKAALEKLSSPERLDMLMSITTPKGWLALIALAVCVALALAWSILGRISSTVSGPGILLSHGGLYEVSALGSGLIVELHVKEEETITQGTVIAVVDQPELANRIELAKKKRQELQEEWARTDALAGKRMQLGRAALEQKRQEQEHVIASARQQLEFLEKRREALQKALAEGTISQSELQQFYKEIDRERERVGDAEVQLKSIVSEEYGLELKKEQEMLSINQRMSEQDRAVAELVFELQQKSSVRSLYAGRVVELKVRCGSLVQAGAPIAMLEPIDAPLQAFIFIPGEAKKVSSGMPVHISPTTVQRERFGSMIGKVVSTSSMPATEAALMNLLRNELLVKQVTQHGAPFIVTVELDRDASAFSGYRWTSLGGPPVKIESGMSCAGRIIVEENRPVVLVVPALKELLGLQ